MKPRLNGSVFAAVIYFAFAGVARPQPYTFTTIAGQGWNSGSADGTNSDARFYSPSGIAVDSAGNLYLADEYNCTIRKLKPQGTNWVVSTIAGQAGSSGSADGTNSGARFYAPSGIAIDSAANLYVADTANYTIRKLKPQGTNWVVNTIAGLAWSFGSADGTNSDARFYNPSGIAADSAGNLYVTDTGNYTIRKLTPRGTNWVVSTIAGSVAWRGGADGTNSDARFWYPFGIAADSAGSLYVADEYNSTIRKLTPQGTNWVVSTIAGSAQNSGNADGTNSDARFFDPCGIAVDNAGSVYVADTYNSRIRKLTLAGTNWVVSTLGGSSIGYADGTGSAASFYYPQGIVADSAGNIYVADTQTSTIRRGAYVVPDVTTTAATNLTSSSEVLTGVINPNGLASAWAWFDWGLSTNYGQQFTVGSVGNDHSPHNVTAQIYGLACGATYYFRLAVVTPVGTNYGADLAFTMPGAPVVTAVPASDIVCGQATLNAKVNPNGLFTSGRFDWGPTTNYGYSSGYFAYLSGTSTLDVTNRVGYYITCPATYHFRLVAVNDCGTTYGADLSFTTPGGPPIVSTDPATDISLYSATLHGTVQPNWFDTTGWFEWGATTNYGNSTGQEGYGSGTNSFYMSTTLSGLTPGATYHFHTVAANYVGTSYGPDAAFVCLPLPTPPTVTTQPAGNVTCSSATFNGTVNPNGKPTTFWFEYDVNGPGYNTVPFPIGDGTNAVPVSALAGSLCCEIHFRLVATNIDGIVYGSYQTFTVPRAPDVSTYSASSLTPDSALIAGLLRPNGTSASGWFEWGTTTNYGNTTPATDVGSGYDYVSYSRTLTGLSPNTAYHFRSLCTNGGCAAIGGDMTFTTPGGPPIFQGYPPTASSITATSATLTVWLSPNWLPTTAWFEWYNIYLSTNYDHVSVPTDMGSGTNGNWVNLNAVITGLSSGACYYVRAVATNSSGIAYAPLAWFFTLGPPSPFTGWAGDIAPTSATLRGSVDPLGLPATAWFEWGTTTGYGHATAPVDVGSGSTNVPVSAGITGLSPMGTYHYRMVGANSAGTRYGGDSVFTTTAANDSFDDRIPVSGTNLASASSNVNATSQPGEPSISGPHSGGKSVWWTWTAPFSGGVDVRTTGSSFPAILGVYTGWGLGNLTLVASDAETNGDSYVTFKATYGVAYQILVDGYDGATGDILLSLILFPSPANDDRANAISLTGQFGVYQATGSNSGATKESGEPAHAGNRGGKSVWWSWTAPSNGSAQISTDGSDFDTLLAVYPASSPSGTPLASNDDDGRKLTSSVTLDIAAGTTYLIAVDGYDGDSGNVALKLTLSTVPSNDNFANRRLLGSVPIVVFTENCGATLEPGEPGYGGQTEGHSLWWTWQAPSAGGAVLTAQSSEFIPLLTVYTGTSISNLVPVTDTSAGAAAWTVTPGQSYQIAMGGAYGDCGAAGLTLSLQSAPSNDNFSQAAALSGGNGGVNGTTIGATREPGEPAHAGRGTYNSVWWNWTAPISGGVTLVINATNFYPVVGVYTGTSVSALTSVTPLMRTDLDPPSGQHRETAVFRATQGVTYRIAVDRQDVLMNAGNFSLTLTAESSPPNDNFADRAAVSGYDVVTSGSNVGASLEPGEPVGGSGKSVWWSWTFPMLGCSVSISTAGSGVPTAVRVYSGDSLGNLTLVASNSPARPNVVAFTMCGGNPGLHTTYQIAVDSYDGSEGNIALHCNYSLNPPNDNFADRIALAGTNLTVAGASLNAFAEPGEPDHGGWPAGKSVWWSWTVTNSGRAFIETSGSFSGMTLSVYEGSSLASLTPVPLSCSTNMLTFHAGHLFSFDVTGVQGSKTYQIAVDGTNNLSGPIQLQLVLVPNPANDNFENRTLLGGSFLTASESILAATREPSEPAHGDATQTRTVWWSWTAPYGQDLTGGDVTLTATATDGLPFCFAPGLAVYLGDSLAGLTRVDTSDEPVAGLTTGWNVLGSGSRVRQVAFQAEPGSTYQIAVTGPDSLGPCGPLNEGGHIDLTLNFTTLALRVTNLGYTVVPATFFVPPKISLSAEARILNYGTAASRPVRIRLVNRADYNAPEIGAFACDISAPMLPMSVPPQTSVEVPFTGSCSPVYALIIAVLEEQVGTNWLTLGQQVLFVLDPSLLHLNFGVTILSPSLTGSGFCPVQIDATEILGPSSINDGDSVALAGRAVFRNNCGQFSTNLFWQTAWDCTGPGLITTNGLLSVPSGSSGQVIITCPYEYQGIQYTMTQQISITRFMLANSARLTNGNFQTTLNGALGRTYVIQMATNLNAGVTWIPLATNPVSGAPWVFTDTNTAGSQQRFYRARQVP